MTSTDRLGPADAAGFGPGSTARATLEPAGPILQPSLAHAASALRTGARPASPARPPDAWSASLVAGALVGGALGGGAETGGVEPIAEDPIAGPGLVARRAPVGSAPPADRGDRADHPLARPGSLAPGALASLQRLAGNGAVAAALGPAPTVAQASRAASLTQDVARLRLQHTGRAADEPPAAATSGRGCTHRCGCIAPAGSPSAWSAFDGAPHETHAPSPAPAVAGRPVPVSRLVTAAPPAATAPAPVAGHAAVQREGEENPNEAKLRAVQGQAMFALLPTLAGMDPAVLADEAAARFVGGPRLVVAIRAVKSKGSWKGFASSQAGELAALPTDQIGDVMRFIGAPKDVGLYERDSFDGRYDAFVDPVSATITLIMKVKVVPTDPVPPSAEEIAQFKTGFKSTVEKTWSGKGQVKPACPIPGVPAFNTRVVVHFVEAGEHLPVIVYPASVRIGVIETDKQTGQRRGRMAADAGDVTKTEQYQGQPQGQPLRSEQSTAAHEFGHAIGIDHVHCKGEGICYGTNQQEWDDVMGGGMKLQRMNVGGGVHSDFAAFEKIGERWGKDIFPGPLATKCNKWGG